MPPPWALSQTVPSGRPRLPRVRTQNFAINYVRLSSVSREFLSVISRQEFVLDAVRQGLPARFHDVFGDPDRPPFFLVVTRLDQHAHLGGRPLARREHAHFVVQQLDLRELRIKSLKGLSVGMVQRVQGTG